jgi:hypothetical protein
MKYFGTAWNPNIASLERVPMVFPFNTLLVVIHT